MSASGRSRSGAPARWPPAERATAALSTSTSAIAAATQSSRKMSTRAAWAGAGAPSTRRNRLEPPCGDRARHQHAQAEFVERNDGGEIQPSERVVDPAHRGHHDAWLAVVPDLLERQPEIH